MGVVPMTVVQEDPPFFLSVGFLDFLGTSMDLPENQLRYKNTDAVDKMRTLPSGHRLVNVTGYSGFGPQASLVEALRDA